MPTVKSMTGFARREATLPAGTLCCELRAVNHRYLELQLRLPDALRAIEQPARERLRDGLGRGKVDCNLRFAPRQDASGSVSVDESLVAALLGACARIEELAPGRLGAPGVLDLMRWPGVVREDPVDSDDLGAAALALLEGTMAELGEMRSREGSRLAGFLEQRLDGIEALAEGIRRRMPQAIAAQRTRLVERLAELLAHPPAERLDQELALLAARGDVAEELDRLEAHVAETRRGLRAGGSCGRRLDFLMQEFNREANTLSSKSLDKETTQAAVEMKVLIEQMREQVQNIE